MKVTVFVDVLFVLNLLINYFLILFTFTVSHIPFKKFRAVIGSGIGSIYACFIFFLSLPTYLVFVSKFLVALLIVYISFSPKSLEKVFHLGLIFLISSLMLGGACYFIMFIFSPLNMAFNNTIVYFNISPVFLILVTLVTYLVVYIIEVFVKPKFNKTEYEVIITHNKKSVVISGFIDTGNKLIDYFTNFPVVVCSYHSLKDILTPQEKEFYSNFSIENSENLYKEKIRIIPINTVSSSGVLPAFVPEGFVLKNKAEVHNVKNVIIAVSKETSLKDKPIILNSQLILE